MNAVWHCFQFSLLRFLLLCFSWICGLLCIQAFENMDRKENSESIVTILYCGGWCHNSLAGMCSSASCIVFVCNTMHFFYINKTKKFLSVVSFRLELLTFSNAREGGSIQMQFPLDLARFSVFIFEKFLFYVCIDSRKNLWGIQP